MFTDADSAGAGLAGRHVLGEERLQRRGEERHDAVSVFSSRRAASVSSSGRPGGRESVVSR
jgi:hypothetical protein